MVRVGEMSVKLSGEKSMQFLSLHYISASSTSAFLHATGNLQQQDTEEYGKPLGYAATFSGIEGE